MNTKQLNHQDPGSAFTRKYDMTRFHQIVAVLLAITMLMLSGCISLVPTPNYARAGDVVNIGLGGLKRNANMQFVNPWEMTITLTDANTVEHTPQVVGVYRVFPDHTSSYSVTAQERNNTTFGDLYPHDGAVWVTVRLTDSGRVPLPLAVGPAFITVDSPQLTQTGKTNEGEYSSFPIEILPGTGQPSLTDQQNQAYQTDGYLTIKPSAPLVGAVGGVQLEIVFDASLTDNDPIDLSVVPLNHDPNLNLIQRVADNGDGTKTLTALLTNPRGFDDLTNYDQLESNHYDLYLGLISWNGEIAAITDESMDTYFTITENSYYADLNGDPIPGVAPVLTNEIL
jgi:hypothetical protein